jgi:hypothetical protein
VGVILDVSAAGKITVGQSKVLTVKHSAKADGIGSAGIFTLAVTGGAVKANAVTPKNSSGAIADASALAAAKVLKLAANAGEAFGTGDLGAGAVPGTDNPANGTITGGETTAIDKKDTFAVAAIANG